MEFVDSDKSVEIKKRFSFKVLSALLQRWATALSNNKVWVNNLLK